jgi:hypothetical protein
MTLISSTPNRMAVLDAQVPTLTNNAWDVHTHLAPPHTMTTINVIWVLIMPLTHVNMPHSRCHLIQVMWIIGVLFTALGSQSSMILLIQSTLPTRVIINTSRCWVSHAPTQKSLSLYNHPLSLTLVVLQLPKSPPKTCNRKACFRLLNSTSTLNIPS